MLERIRLIIAERLAAARALIASYATREPLADGTTPQESA